LYVWARVGAVAKIVAAAKIAKAEMRIRASFADRRGAAPFHENVFKN
jgi:hypothetical protein